MVLEAVSEEDRAARTTSAELELQDWALLELKITREH